MLGWWNHGSSTLGWSRLQGCSRDHQDDKSTFTMNSSWLGSPIAQRYLQYPDDRKSGLSIVLVPLEKGGAHFRTHERHDFHLQRKGVVEAKDVRFPPQLKWIETVGQKIGICEMQCCSDMVRYIYIHMIIYIYIYINLDIYILIYIYVWIFIWFGNAETWLTHLWQIWSFFIQTGTLQSEPPFLRVRLKMSDPPNRMEMMNLSRKNYWFWWDAW